MNNVQNFELNWRILENAIKLKYLLLKGFRYIFCISFAGNVYVGNLFFATMSD